MDELTTFETISQSIVEEHSITRAWIDPCTDSPPVAPARARRTCFRIAVSPRTFDLFYNSADGLRGRYWQSPNAGFLATKALIEQLSPTLMSFAAANPFSQPTNVAPMSDEDVARSLSVLTAKIWVRERDDDRNIMVSPSQQPQLIVPRWVRNESDVAGLGTHWRWTPLGSELEIKGGFLGPDGEEYIPEGKRDRSCQIHRYGFT